MCVCVCVCVCVLQSMGAARAAMAAALADQAVKAGGRVAPGAHILMPSHTCEIKSEVLPEFREIEKIK